MPTLTARSITWPPDGTSQELTYDIRHIGDGRWEMKLHADEHHRIVRTLMDTIAAPFWKVPDKSQPKAILEHLSVGPRWVEFTQDGAGEEEVLRLLNGVSRGTSPQGADVALQALQPQQSLQIAVGDAGFARAVEEAKRSAHDAPLFDMRVDLHTTSVLSFIRRDCLEVHALAGSDRR